MHLNKTRGITYTYTTENPIHFSRLVVLTTVPGKQRNASGNTAEKERKERQVYINEQTNSNGTTENEYYYNTEPVRYQKGRGNAQNRQTQKPQKRDRRCTDVARLITAPER